MQAEHEHEHGHEHEREREHNHNHDHTHKHEPQHEHEHEHEREHERAPHGEAELEASRRTIRRRLAVADTDGALEEHWRGRERGAGFNARLMAAGRRLLVAKAMHPRLGGGGPLFQRLSLDLIQEIAAQLPTVASLSGEWRVRGAFSSGEQYCYAMHLTEHADGRITGHGRFGEHPVAPSFVVTRGLVTQPPLHGPVLHMRQEAHDFVNFCSCLLRPDRGALLEGEWMQLDQTADEEAWDAWLEAPFTTQKPQPAPDDFSHWGWWAALPAEEDARVHGERPARKKGPPRPGVIGTPVQWVAGMPLRRPPDCITCSRAEKGAWPDPGLAVKVISQVTISDGGWD